MPCCVNSYPSYHSLHQIEIYTKWRKENAQTIPQLSRRKPQECTSGNFFPSSPTDRAQYIETEQITAPPEINPYTSATPSPWSAVPRHPRHSTGVLCSCSCFVLSFYTEALPLAHQHSDNCSCLHARTVRESSLARSAPRVFRSGSHHGLRRCSAGSHVHSVLQGCGDAMELEVGVEVTVQRRRAPVVEEAGLWPWAQELQWSREPARRFEAPRNGLRRLERSVVQVRQSGCALRAPLFGMAHIHPLPPLCAL